ncbi:MAG: radical SAM protein [Candidatus Bathyarchaeota archaeon]|nr:radical SAM protein [Candidatus Bathyarchaeota archaeon]MDH5635752.1 radical SAM protein [Candidatus Bathyarchaeota archaeon]
MSFVRKVFRASKIPQGRYTYRGRGDFTGLALQLRVEPDGRGLLVINANTVLYLNETATAHAFFFMQGMTTDEAIKKIRRMYRVNKKTARDDYERLIYTVSTLAQTEEVCPVSFLDVERVEPFTQEFSAPLRVDLALTFRCQNNCVHCYAGGPHETSELTTEQWKEVIDRLHQIGVFILTFTGGEPTLREDLPELLLYGQNKGIVTGLITNGRKLRDKTYVETLEKTGLDFIQVTLESHKPKIHDLITATKGSWKETVAGIKNIIPTKIYATTNTTLSKYNASDFLETIDFLKELGVAAFGCNSLIYSGKANAMSEEFVLPLETLRELLPKIHDKANQLGLKFLWYTPTQYCRLDPVQLGLGVKSCTAAMINMCIGPNGDVYPCQSYFESLGNILKDDWQKIWNHPFAVRIRKREYTELKCKDCPQLQICGGGCPLELQKKNFICAETQ